MEAYNAQAPSTCYVAYDRQHRTRTNQARYDGLKRFTSLEAAIRFAEEHMPAAAIKLLPASAEDIALARDPAKPYALIGVYRVPTYSWCEYDGDVDEYIVARSTAETLDVITDELAAKKYFVRIYRGIELDTSGRRG